MVFGAALSMLTASVFAGPLFFSTGDPDGQMATASRPDGGGKIEIESADDFVLTQPTTITGAIFTGLLTGGTTVADIGEVRVEIYRVFPLDSDTTRTPAVPTRANSPSDVELSDRDNASGNLSFTPSVLAPSFTASNSVLNGINLFPNQTTGGEGPITGQEVQFDIDFLIPFVLPANHYFFIPQVEITDVNGDFFWLSAARPIAPPGTPFPAGFTDLQSWIRNDNLAPDWLRVGTDIVGGAPAPTFNASFSLISAVPEPATLLLIAVGLAVLWWGLKRKP
jgi:hypothetical protein